MLLNEMFNEAPYSDSSSVIFDKYKDVIYDYFNSGLTPIYRGMKRSADVILGDGNQVYRKSANARNYYNLLISEYLPEWKQFPQRNKSFICTTDFSYAYDYTKEDGVYFVIPLENQNIGVCPKGDIWASFKNFQEFGFDQLDSLDECLYFLGKKLLEKKINNPTIFDLVYDINEIDKKIKDISLKMKREIYDYAGVELGKNFIEKGVMDTLKYILEPSDFRIMKYTDNLPKDREVWMSGRVLFIHHKDSALKGLVS